MKRQPRVKVTYVVDRDVAEGIKRAVDAGLAGSQSGLVQDAVAAYLANARKAELRDAYARAAGDPEFIADVESVMEDFTALDDQVGSG